MTELQKQLLLDLRTDKVKSEVSIQPAKDKPLARKPEGPRDESTLTYEELIEDFLQFEKSAIMKPETFDRLWNS